MECCLCISYVYASLDRLVGSRVIFSLRYFNVILMSRGLLEGCRIVNLSSTYFRLSTLQRDQRRVWLEGEARSAF